MRSKRGVHVGMEEAGEERGEEAEKGEEWI